MSSRSRAASLPEAASLGGRSLPCALAPGWDANRLGGAGLWWGWAGASTGSLQRNTLPPCSQPVEGSFPASGHRFVKLSLASCLTNSEF